MKKILCLLKGHARGKTKYYKGYWGIQCKRCSYWTYYKSPFARLIGKEIQLGFTGD